MKKHRFKNDKEDKTEFLLECTISIPFLFTPQITLIQREKEREGAKKKKKKVKCHQ